MEIQDRLMTLKQFCEAFQWPSESAMRAYIYRAPEFGIESAFIRVGKRVLVNPKVFFEVIKTVDLTRKKKAKKSW